MDKDLRGKWDDYRNRCVKFEALRSDLSSAEWAYKQLLSYQATNPSSRFLPPEIESFYQKLKHFRRCVRKERIKLRIENANLIRLVQLAEPAEDFLADRPCGRCRDVKPMRNLRLHKKDGMIVGLFCTDCYYLHVAYAGWDTECKRFARAVLPTPSLDCQESMEADELTVRSTEHRDLRWEFGFVGRNLERQYRSGMKRKHRTHQNAEVAV